MLWRIEKPVAFSNDQSETVGGPKTGHCYTIPVRPYVAVNTLLNRWQ
jgi:hypothetical protein